MFIAMVHVVMKACRQSKGNIGYQMLNMEQDTISVTNKFPLLPKVFLFLWLGRIIPITRTGENVLKLIKQAC